MTKNLQERKEKSWPAIAEGIHAMDTEELLSRREELANQINPLWLRLDQIDDELMARDREIRRQRVLAPPPIEALTDSHIEPAGAA